MKIENDQYKEKDMGPLFDICERKHGGNPMSVQANKIAHDGKLGARKRILFVFSTPNRKDWTCEEIEDQTGLSHQSCSARCSELRREGKIKIVGERKTRSGAMAAVYQYRSTRRSVPANSRTLARRRLKSKHGGFGYSFN